MKVLFVRFLLSIAAILPLAIPVNAADPLSVRIASDAGQLRLSWGPAPAGAKFTVETAKELEPADWRPLGVAAGWPTTGTNWSAPLPRAGTAYFRVTFVVPPQRGTLLTNVFLRSRTPAEMLAVLRANSIPALSALGVDAWRLVYSTVDALGQPTQASALAVLPQGAGKASPIVSYQHGTIMLREDVPSRLQNDEADLGLILGATGYLAVLPDYLGLGDSPGRHPYLHAKSEATAVVDALRAMRAFLEARSVSWNKQLFLVGYSQGGHATLAAQREIETLHADEFKITASAPCAGPHDLSGTMTTDMLSARIPPNPYYYAYLVAAYSDVYEGVPAFSELLKAPYDATLPPLFDGQHHGGQVNAAMPAPPAKPSDMLKPGVLADFTSDPNHPLRLALRDNDLYTGWVPKVPTRFYHCAGDQDVLQANSKVAYEAFKAAGAPDVEFIDPLSFADHGGCSPWALIGTKFWFDTLRQ